MGLDINAFRFLLNKSKTEKFKDTVTLGRQNCHVSLRQLRKAGWENKTLPNFIEEICEDLFGSTSGVASVDTSTYEGASIVHNMNDPLPNNVKEFDTVLDLGTLELVFNIKQSMLNTSKLVKNGGLIIHVLPANNLTGHGFYQFSPEFFFSMYSEENGYIETEVYLKSINSSNSYYRVKPPNNGKRVNVNSVYPVYVLVSTRKIQLVEQMIVQQSDYIYLWSGDISNKKVHSTKPKQDEAVAETLWDKWPIKYLYRPYVLLKNSISSLNPHLEKYKL